MPVSEKKTVGKKQQRNNKENRGIYAEYLYFFGIFLQKYQFPPNTSYHKAPEK